MSNLPWPSPADQYRAAMTGCVLFDLLDREHIELTGRDRASFLHNFCTQEIKRLPAGSGAEALVTNIKGRILGHVFVFVGEEALWLDGPPGMAAALVPHLDRYLITEEVQIQNRSADWGELLLVGPQGAALVESLVPGSEAFTPFQHGSHEGMTVRRCDVTGSPGWLIGAERSRLPGVQQQLIAAGAVPGSREVWEALRIEAGFPLHGIDLTEDHLAHEAARTSRTISFTKGCYLGQEPIARLESLGHTNRQLCRLRLQTADIPPAGTKVLNPEDGSEQGTISSAALSPVDNVAVALAMLRRGSAPPGTVVVVSGAEGTVEG